MRNGYTTGSTACAAACAACIYKLYDYLPETVRIALPDGSLLDISVHKDGLGIFALKDGGDDIDATHGMKIYADIAFNDSGHIDIHGGTGIGTVTKKGLQVSVGKSAINPVPLRMIKDNLTALLGNRGADVTISAPEGEEIAKKTFNEKVGVTGGISIIGTTGIVTPMSTEAIIETIKCEIDVACAEGAETLCLAPGKIGEKHFKEKLSNVPVVLMSNFTKEALDYAYAKGFRNITVAGHPGKLCKILMGYYNTHSKNSPMATEFLAEKLGLKAAFNTVEEILTETDAELSAVAQELAEKIEKEFRFQRVSVIFYDMKGRVKGERF